MFLEIVDFFVLQFQRFRLHLHLSPTAIVLVSTVLGSWLAWRLWTFTIIPLLWPNRPKPLPYLIPYVGHTISFLRDPEGTLSYGYNYFKSREPFAIRVGGIRLVILTDVQDVASLWKQTKALTFDYFCQNIMAGVGVSRSSRVKMFQENPAHFMHGSTISKSRLIRENPREKCYVDLQDEWIKEQLLPGDRMDAIQITFLGYINRSLQWGMSSPKYVLSDTPGEKVVGLHNWVRYVLVDAGTKAFLGPGILNIDPDFVQHYIDFEEASWKLAHQHPSFLSRDLHVAKSRLIKTFATYYQLPDGQRPELNWLFHTMQSEQQQLGLSIDEAAAMNLIMFWGVNNNAWLILFWILAHTLCDPALHAIVYAETAPACRKDGTVDMNHLITNCPQLDAIWHEVLRLYNTAAAIRNAEQETEIAGKKIYPGDQVLGPFRYFHLRTDIFGDHTTSFDAARFLKDKTLANVKGYYPFGGGKTYCPGRFIAKQETYLFVAVVLARFELTPLSRRDLATGGYRVPRVDRQKPSLAAMDPLDDLRIKVRVRETST